uniref:sphingomyelin phosphodiesterase n=1 Tax=Salmo trutta TaxID=8032 RepID=A0A673XBP9_SALTR
MVLHTSPYSSAFLRCLSSLSWGFIFPCYWLLDRLLSSCVATSLEKRRRSQDPCSFVTLYVLVSTPLYLLLLLASLPFALLGFLLWAPLQAARHPYLYTHRRPDNHQAEQGGVASLADWRPQGRSFCFGSSNVCLLPDSLARFNNLSETQRRAREVGKRIRNGATRPQIKIYIDSPTNTSISATSFSSLVLTAPYTQRGTRAPQIVPAPEPDPPEAGTGNHQGEGDAESLTGGVSSNNTLSHRTSMFKKHTGRKRRQGDDGFDHEISAFFPANLDFLCLQEVFDHRAMSRLRQQLHHYFPYILSDVGRYAWKGCCSRFKFLNSGVMLASRYPILDAHYECYPNGRGEDALAAKGVLFIKVQVGTSHQEQRVVGYLTCTHLHAIEGDAAVRCEQLDLLLAWGAEFRKMTSRPSEEKGLEDQVAFDVLSDCVKIVCSLTSCRNSPLCFSLHPSISEDKLEQQHAVFTQYKDPCGLGPGEDKPWALGDCLLVVFVDRVMENEEGRKEYLVFPTNKNQCPNQKGRKIPLKGNGRRIDYILYREEDIEEFSFITQLAGLTDHLSVAMRLAVSTGEEEP